MECDKQQQQQQQIFHVIWIPSIEYGGVSPLNKFKVNKYLSWTLFYVCGVSSIETATDKWFGSIILYVKSDCGGVSGNATIHSPLPAAAGQEAPWPQPALTQSISCSNALPATRLFSLFTLSGGITLAATVASKENTEWT